MAPPRKVRPMHGLQGEGCGADLAQDSVPAARQRPRRLVSLTQSGKATDRCHAAGGAKMSDDEHEGPNRIESLHVKGFRSLADLRLDDIPNLMVLLGPNGAGKSNILRFLQMLGALAHCGLGEFVRRQGGADGQLFGGSQRTERIEAKVFSRTDQGSHAYAATLERTGEDEFAFANEEFTPWHADGRAGLNWGRNVAGASPPSCGWRTPKQATTAQKLP